MSHTVEHIFAVIGCVTVTAGAVTGLLVALGILKLKLQGSVTRDDDEP